MSDSLKYHPEVHKQEHDKANRAKRVLIMGWDADNLEAVKLNVDENGNLGSEYDSLIDLADSDTTYIGKVKAGSAGDTSEAIWQIKKLDESSELKFTFADGVTTFSKVWDDRTSYSY